MNRLDTSLDTASTYIRIVRASQSSFALEESIQFGHLYINRAQSLQNVTAVTFHRVTKRSPMPYLCTAESLHALCKGLWLKYFEESGQGKKIFLVPSSRLSSFFSFSRAKITGKTWKHHTLRRKFIILTAWQF